MYSFFPRHPRECFVNHIFELLQKNQKSIGCLRYVLSKNTHICIKHFGSKRISQKVMTTCRVVKRHQYSVPNWVGYTHSYDLMRTIMDQKHMKLHWNWSILVLIESNIPRVLVVCRISFNQPTEELIKFMS